VRGFFLLTLHGIWFRRTASLAAFAVAIVATAAATLGPLYARSAEDSLVREQLHDAPPEGTTFTLSTSSVDQVEYTVDELRKGIDLAAASSDLDRWYGPVATRLGIWNVPVQHGPTDLGLTNLTWHGDGGCHDVVIVSGRCPTDKLDLMVSKKTATSAHLKVGSKLRLLVGASQKGLPGQVVGVYDGAAPRPATWGLDDPQQAAVPPGPNAPSHIDEVVMTDELMRTTDAEVHVVADRPLVADKVHASDTAALRAPLEQLETNPKSETGISFRTNIPLLGLLDSLAQQRSLVRTAAFAVTAQLVLLAWFVLFVIVGSTMDERSSEIAMAKLRGLKTRSTGAFALSETALLLTAALPLGLLLGWVVNAALTEKVLAPGTEFSLNRSVLAALVVAWVGGSVAAYAATRRTLRAPVLEQMRRVSGGRAQVVRSISVETTAVVLAIVGAYELRKGGSDTVALLTPGAIALAVGLLCVRVVPLLARRGVATTRRSPRIASFLAVRALARRPSGLRLVTLLVVAVALATFAVDAWAVASSTRLERARIEVGAPTVYNVSTTSAAKLLADVRALDPKGTWAMAAAQTDTGVLAVDAPRLANVTAWDGAGLGLPLSRAAARLHPASGPSLTVHEHLSLSGSAVSKAEHAGMTLGAAIRSPDGVLTTYDFGTLGPKAHKVTRTLNGCAHGCVFEGFVFNADVPSVDGSEVAGGMDVTINDVTDSRGPVDLTAVKWRDGRLPDAVVQPLAVPKLDLAVTSTGLDGVVSSIGPTSGILEPADHPLDLPGLLSKGQPLDGFSDGTSLLLSPGIDGSNTVLQPVGNPTYLPRVLTGGQLVDLEYVLRTSRTPLPTLRTYVWVGPNAPSDARARLTGAGLKINGTESVAARRHQLDREGTALALGIFLVAALAAVLLAGGALLATTTAAARRRSYELASLRVLGARDRVLVAASRRELLALVLVAVVVGAVCGLVGARLVIPTLPAVDGEGSLVHANYGPAWLAVLAVAVAVLAVGWLVAQVSARRTVRLAMLDRLREAEG
jgi:hypothetical protein